MLWYLREAKEQIEKGIPASLFGDVAERSLRFPGLPGIIENLLAEGSVVTTTSGEALDFGAARDFITKVPEGNGLLRLSFDREAARSSREFHERLSRRAQQSISAKALLELWYAKAIREADIVLEACHELYTEYKERA